MHYTHHFHVIRHRKHALPISLIVLGLILTLIFSYGFTQVNAAQFLGGFILSFYRVFVAYAISLTTALFISLLVTQNRSIEDLCLPLLDALQSFPSFSVLPLLIAFLGKSDVVAIIILTMAMIWPILFSIMTAIKSQSDELKDASTIFGATGFKRIWHVTLPTISPAITTGSIVAWGEAWETVLAAEIIIRIPGVGTYLATAGENSQPNVLIIGILILMAILFILNKFFWIPLLNKTTEYS